MPELTILNSDLNIETNFDKNDSCPICHSNKYEEVDSNYKNVYSELISNYLGLDESYLLEFASLNICSNCDTHYWRNQISAKLRSELYNNILPIHPKGIDSTGKFFSIKGLKEKVYGIEDGNPKKIRIFEGYFSSFKFENDFEKEICKNAFENLDDAKNISTLDKFFQRGAKDLSRHAGFRNTNLNDFIIEYFDKEEKDKIKYIEYGCPCWGPLTTFVKSKYKCLSIIPDDSIFWSNYNNEYTYNSRLLTINEFDLKYKIQNLEGANLGLILILDHLEDPVSFLRKFIDLGINSISIIVEKIETKKGLPIQHLTGWNERSLSYLAKTLNLKIKYFNADDQSYIFAVFEV